MKAREHIYVLRRGKLVRVRVIVNATDSGYLIVSTSDMQLPLWWPVNFIVIIALTAYYLIQPRVN